MEKQKQDNRCPICGRFISGTTLRKAVDLRRETDEQRQMINALIAERGKAAAREASLRQKNADLLLEVANLTSDLNRLKSRGLIARILNK